MTTVTTTPDQRLVAVYADDAPVSATIPVDKSASTGTVRVMRVVVPVKAGDVLDITAEARVTNDVGYNCGVGSYLAWYDVDDGIAWPHAQPWTRIGTSTGDNVDPQRHHMPLTLTRAYVVPASWPDGHRMVINLMVDGHSTAAQSGDTLTVDDYGQMIVRRWTAAQGFLTVRIDRGRGAK
ncbi:hypothetical protein [Actinomadura sp. SCN-SB]|uniref:hypothetical protein n=1 Tax=Actinomadura sp. SCN-SB TaxID=3373092 RepID=UPI003752F37D